MAKIRKLLCLLLTLLLVSAPMAVLADEEETAPVPEVKATVYLSSPQDLVRLAESCRLDSWSRGVTVELTKDIDLTGVDFRGIPSFSGTLDGKGWRITGLNLTHDGSNVGLIRYLTAEGTVRDLHVEGVVAPGGSSCAVGGIAGESAGRIENCSFSGQVAGTDKVGGMAGILLLTGIIENCTVSGTVSGTHFVGGMAGTSSGVIRDCENLAGVNHQLEQNRVSLEDITLDSLTGSESAVTVTDIGGIVGNGSGVVRDCVNRGSVGYPQIGYNIGGIAGCTNGYLYGCVNYGTVQGRKEVGGIVGQLEPALSILFSEDALQMLKSQMGGMASIAATAGAHAQSGIAAIRTEAERLNEQKENAKEALEMLAPSPEFPFVPDLDTIQASKNALCDSLLGMNESVHSMADIGKDTVSTLANDVQNLAGQLGAIGNTVSTAEENLGASVADVSDLDTPEDLTAKVEACRNEGSVSGDWNVGGIAGSAALENDLDPESDLDLAGSYSLNFAMELRCVVLNCENSGQVTCGKLNAGGIMGWMSMGLVRESVNRGTVEAASAEYVGGIVGRSQGAIRLCSQRGIVSGSRYVGGIAGTAATVSDCAALVRLDNAREFSGAILGSGQPETISGCTYLPIGSDPGALDGISYEGQAQAADKDSFFALETLPNDFQKVRVTFLMEGGKERTVTLDYGQRLPEARFPRLTAPDGSEAAWEPILQPEDPVYFDTVIRALYTSHRYTLESELKNRNGLPLLLVQGDFLDGSAVAMEKLDTDGIEAWTLSLPESAQPMKLRYLLPQDRTADQVLLYVRCGEEWAQADCEANGSYLVFSAPEGTNAIRLEEAPEEPLPWPLIAAGAGAVLVLILAIVLISRHRKKKKAEQPEEEPVPSMNETVSGV